MYNTLLLFIIHKVISHKTTYHRPGIYLTISMAVTSLSIILTVVVLKLHYSGHKVYAVPVWLRSLVLERLASVVYCRCDNPFRSEIVSYIIPELIFT